MEDRRKKLKYRAAHRGFKEADLIIGGFAELHVDDMNEAQLNTFEHLLEAPDHELYAWIIGREETPANYQSDVMELLQRFRYQPPG